jgi:hypothetical protein
MLLLHSALVMMLVTMYLQNQYGGLVAIVNKNNNTLDI